MDAHDGGVSEMASAFALGEVAVVRTDTTMAEIRSVHDIAANEDATESAADGPGGYEATFARIKDVASTASGRPLVLILARPWERTVCKP
jgi:hypothetical protein